MGILGVLFVGNCLGMKTKLSSSNDPNFTALGLQAGPGCFAVDFDVIPPHALMWVEGEGWGVAGDAGGAIRGKRIDIYRGSYDLAMRGGR